MLFIDQGDSLFLFFLHYLVPIKYEQFLGCVAVDPVVFVLHFSTSKLDHRGLCKLVNYSRSKCMLLVQ